MKVRCNATKGHGWIPSWVNREKQKKQNKTKNKTYKQVEAICIHERGKVKLVLIDVRNFPGIFDESVEEKENCVPRLVKLFKS